MGLRVLLADRHAEPVESDEQLTAQARSGDQSAFAELYRRHRKAAQSTARYLVHSRSEADDAVADAFAGVLAAMRNGRGPRDNFRTYLLACVRNNCRVRRPEGLPLSGEGSERWMPTFEDPERYAEADVVARAFANLAPRWQHTLWLTEVEQLSAHEVGDQLRLSPNATAALAHRARQAFATAYLSEHVAATENPVCAGVASRLAAYVRDDLTIAQRAAVDSHIASCSQCAKAVDELRDVNSSLRTLVPLTPGLIPAGMGTNAALVASLGGASFGVGGGGVLLIGGLAAVLVVAPIVAVHQLAQRDAGDSTVEIVAPAATAALLQQPVATTTTSSTTMTMPVPGQTAPAAGDVLAAAPSPPNPPAASSTPAVTVPAIAIPTVAVMPTTPSSELTIPPNLIATVSPVVARIDESTGPIIDPLVGPVIEAVDHLLVELSLPPTAETIAIVSGVVPAPLSGTVVPMLDIALSLLPLDTAGDQDGGGNDELDTGSAPGPADAVAADESPASTPASTIASTKLPAAQLAPPESAPSAPPGTSSPAAPAPSLSTDPPQPSPRVTVPAPTALTHTDPPTTVPSTTAPGLLLPVISVAPVEVPLLDIKITVP